MNVTLFSHHMKDVFIILSCNRHILHRGRGNTGRSPDEGTYLAYGVHTRKRRLFSPAIMRLLCIHPNLSPIGSPPLLAANINKVGLIYVLSFRHLSARSLGFRACAVAYRFPFLLPPHHTNPASSCSMHQYTTGNERLVVAFGTIAISGTLPVPVLNAGILHDPRAEG